MSQDMSSNSDTDGLAAEYVLGTLDADERSEAQKLLAEDAEFAAKVKFWERRLGELHLMVEPVEPEPDIWQRIKAKLPEVQPPSPAGRLPEPESTAAEPAPESVPVMPEAPQAAMPEAPPALAPEPPLTTTPEATPATTLEAPPAPAPEAPPEMPGAAPAEIPEATLDAPIIETAVAPPPVAAPVNGREARIVALEHKAARLQRRLARWRAFAALMMLVILSVAALVALWRFAPDRVPPVLQPLELMRLVGITIKASLPPRKPAPPESQFDE